MSEYSQIQLLDNLIDEFVNPEAVSNEMQLCVSVRLKYEFIWFNIHVLHNNHTKIKAKTFLIEQNFTFRAINDKFCFNITQSLRSVGMATKCQQMLLACSVNMFNSTFLIDHHFPAPINSLANNETGSLRLPYCL